MKVLENLKKLCGNTCLRLVFPQHFSFSQTSTGVSTTQQKHRKCFLFLKIISQFMIRRNAKNFNSLSIIWNGMLLISSRYYLFLERLLLDFCHETDQNVWVMDFWCHRVQKYVDFSLSFYLVPVCQQLKILQVMEVLAHLHRPCQAFTKYSS